MRAVLPTLGCLLSAAKVSIACSVVSSPNVRLNVLPDGTPLQGVTLVVSLQVNARQVGPPLKTDARGSAELQNHASGTYCITATADPRLGADLCLVVSNGHDHERNEFSLELVPLPPPPPTLEEQLAPAAKLPSQARAREFEGSVTKVTGASIPHVKDCRVCASLRERAKPNQSGGSPGGPILCPAESRQLFRGLSAGRGSEACAGRATARLLHMTILMKDFD